jgi:hypothetical protein
MPEKHRELTLDLHRTAPEFIAELAERVVGTEPDLVGFTSTFQQNIPVLALARAIKLLAPRTLVAMGGANCDGAQGEALHRNFPFLDFVQRGEGETAFPELLRNLRAGRSVAQVPGLCWRGPAGESVVNEMSTRPLAPAEIVAPDYDGYFERLDVSAAREWVEPKLVVEGARGCWWGEKHHCTFCGLNGSFMQFRSKSPNAFLDEILGLVRELHLAAQYLMNFDLPEHELFDLAYLFASQDLGIDEALADQMRGRRCLAARVRAQPALAHRAGRGDPAGEPALRVLLDDAEDHRPGAGGDVPADRAAAHDPQPRRQTRRGRFPERSGRNPGPDGRVAPAGHRVHRRRLLRACRTHLHEPAPHAHRHGQPGARVGA